MLVLLIMMMMISDDDADENISMTLLPSGLADGSHAGLSQWSSLISHEKRCRHNSLFFSNAIVELQMVFMKINCVQHQRNLALFADITAYIFVATIFGNIISHVIIRMSSPRLQSKSVWGPVVPKHCRVLQTDKHINTTQITDKSIHDHPPLSPLFYNALRHGVCFCMAGNSKISHVPLIR